MVLTGDKRYIAVLRFGREVTQEELAKLLESLQGEIYNVPPLESAVKVRVRTRIIHDIRIIDADDESRTTAVTITCNAGTYIRTLSRDFGLMLDTRCELLELHRDQTGSFDQSNACTMQQLTDAVFLWREHEDDRALRHLIAPVEAILGHLPRIVVKDGAAAAISHGAALARPGVVSLSEGIERGDLVVLESLKGEAVALAETNSAASKIASMQHGEVARPKVVLMQVGVYPQTWSKE
jgi:predicted rRNA pseudouridine synthase|tara:strand:+ start:487 stop:1200 length:714 start_codon:yes stop_codon:yes gene_type:complete